MLHVPNQQFPPDLPSGPAALLAHKLPIHRPLYRGFIATLLVAAACDWNQQGTQQGAAPAAAFASEVTAAQAGAFMPMAEALPEGDSTSVSAMAPAPAVSDANPGSQDPESADGTGNASSSGSATGSDTNFDPSPTMAGGEVEVPGSGAQEPADTPSAEATAGDQAPSATAAATMNLTLTTKALGGRYAPKNIGAIWIADGQGDWMRTLEVWAQRRERYLSAYRAANPTRDRTDAITSATLRTHREHQVSWDFTDLSGELVPDGTYQVFVEITDKDARGEVTSFSFTKEGPAEPATGPSWLTGVRLEVTPR